MAQMVKSLPAKQETGVQSLGQEEPVEEGMAAHSSILAWRIPLDREAWWATIQCPKSVPFSSVTQSCLTLCDMMNCNPPGSSVHGDSPGKNTGMGCHAPLQGIFPTQGSNPCLLCLLHWQAGFFCFCFFTTSAT